MIIAGGCYRELCEHPRWDATFGSGGRAATALVGHSKTLELYTYYNSIQESDLQELLNHGIVIHINSTKRIVSFAYLHPLSQPVVVPDQSEFQSEEPIRCCGDVVLRFGFYEGDAIVNGGKVIYDPQSVNSPAPFKENGSSARHLAIVLNLSELFKLAPGDSLTKSAKLIMKRDDAEVVVVKCGTKGAAVVENGKKLIWIPAFHTSRIFKIGSGDVFSSTFAHYWGEKGLSPVEASLMASKSTAAYCNSRVLPVPDGSRLPDFQAVSSSSSNRVAVIGAAGTLANYWLIEEARWHLKELGLNTQLVNADITEISDIALDIKSALILADTFCNGAEYYIEKALAAEVPAVVLQEQPMQAGTYKSVEQYTSDFTTALYWTAWT